VLREAAAAITRPMGELLPTSIPGAYSMAQRIPYGVVGAISPWNAPRVLGIRSIAIPLAVGNTVVMKPSEDAPITCGLLLADVLTEAGLPPGSSISSPTTWLMPATWSPPSSPTRGCGW
jgi:vanillin dehydrogenase